MAIRQLTLVLDLDTGTFSQRARTATGDITALSKSIDEMTRRAEANASALDGTVRAVRNYVENGLRLRQTQEQIRVAQDAYVKGLIKELDTMGMSAQAVRDYTAAQLGLTDQTRALRDALDEKAATLKALAEQEAAEALSLREAAEAEQQRLTASEELLNTLREEIVTLRSGSEALNLEKAAALGCAEEYRALTEVLTKLKAEHATAEATMRAFAEAEREAAREAQAEANAIARVERELARQVQAYRERLIAEKGGAVAVAEYRAQQVGMTEAMRTSIAELREMSVQFDQVSGHARSAGRAIYEVNVLTHELFSGRIRQAISSFSILLANIGLASQAVLGLTLSIGILYGISKPIEEAAKHMEELQHQASELGVSIGFLQTLGVATDLMGIKTDKLVAGIGRLDQSFARARQGSKQAVDGYNAVGVSLKENYTNQELLQAVLKGWDKIPDGPRKVAVAMELFGRSGKDLIPVLNELAAKQGEINKKAEEYGLKNEQAIAVGAALAEQFRETSLAMKGLGMQLLVSVGPALIDFLKNMAAMSSSMRAFFADKDRVKQAFDLIKAGIIGVAVALTANAIPAMFRFATSAIPAVIEGLATMVFAARSAILQFGLLDAVMLATPWGLVAAGVGLLAGGLAYLALSSEKASEGQKQLDKAHQDSLTIDQQLIASNKKVREEMEARARADLDGAQKALAHAQADLAAANAAAARAGAQIGNAVGRGVDAASGEYARQAAYAKTAQEERDRAAKAVAEQQANLQKIQNYKPPKNDFGTTDGDPFGTGGKNKRNAAEEALSQLKARVAEIKGAVDDSGSTFQKYNELLNDTSSALYKAVQGHKGLADEIRKAARQVDEQEALKKSKTAYEDLVKQQEIAHKTAQQALQDLHDQTVGTVNLAKARRDAAAAQKATEAQSYAKAKGLDTSGVVEDISNQNEIAQNAKDTSKAIEEFKKKLEEARGATADLWLQYANGATKADVETAKLKAQIDKAIADAKDLQSIGALIQLKQDLIPTIGTEKGLEAAIDFREKTKKINEEISGDTMAKQRAIVEAERDAAYARIKDVDFSTEQGKAIYGDYVAYIKALNDKLKTETPFGKMAQEWGDLTGNLQRAGAHWMDDFVNQLTRGKLNFKDFAKSVIQDLISIIAKAEIAKYILGPIMGALGLSPAPVAAGGGTYGPVMHGGGQVGDPGGIRRTVDPRVFLGAPRLHTGMVGVGLKPDEIPTILQKGESVLTQQQMKSMAGSKGDGPPVTINFQNQSGVPLDADHGGTHFDGEKFVVDVVVSHLQRPGPLRNAFKSSQ